VEQQAGNNLIHPHIYLAAGRLGGRLVRKSGAAVDYGFVGLLWFIESMEGITILDPRFNVFVLLNALLEKLTDGFRWLEGSVWFGDQQCLLVSDLPNNRIMRWTESGGVSVFREPSSFANGHRCVKLTELA
jgi:hypothetical protein